MATELFVDRSVATILGAVGLIVLGVTWKSRSGRLETFAPIGWLLTGFYFFNETPFYLAKEDPILMVMSAACLPGAISIAMWERKENTEHQEKALRWFRGAIFAAGFPYLLIAHVPWLNVLAIWFVAWQSGLFLQWSGAGDIQLGETYVQYADGSTVEWSAWEGNRWFLTEEMSEYSFSTELLGADGTSIGISFVLACTAIQSMIIFVGAISVLEVSWKMKFRALLITLPLIHILNLFRNAGLIWLQSVYVDWRYLGLTIFEFGHAYASRVGSLAAMFLLALVLFDMLPQMHRHVLTLLRPLGLSSGKR